VPDLDVAVLVHDGEVLDGLDPRVDDLTDHPHLTR
jgi:hypothetical protein